MEVGNVNSIKSLSVTQRDAIELQLELLRRFDHSCELFFSNDTEEPFFIKNLENDKLNVVSKENELENKKQNVVSVESELFLRSDERKKIQEARDLLSSKLEEKRKIQQEIEKQKIMLLNKKESLSNNLKVIEQLMIQIREFEDLKKRNFDLPNA